MDYILKWILVGGKGKNEYFLWENLLSQLILLNEKCPYLLQFYLLNDEIYKLHFKYYQ